MRKEYKYSNLKKETNTSGIVTLELMKQRKTKRKPPKITNRQLLEQILKRLDNVENRLDQNDKHWQHQEEFNKYVLDVFKRNNLK